MTRVSFVCTKCGGSSTEVNRARPSLDDRYPVGHCVVCTPWPRLKEHPFKRGEVIQPPRKTVALIRADLFDRADFTHRKKVAAARQLVAKMQSSKGSKMSEAQLKAAREASEWLRREDAA